MICAFHDTIEGACGVGVVHDFNRHTWGDRLGSENYAGAGWVCAGFIDDELCKDAYDELNRKYTLVYQTPTRINENSGNDFFFAIWDTHDKSEDPQ